MNATTIIRPALRLLPYALVILVVSAGSAWAAATITSAQIKDRSLLARDLKRNTITGAEVNESKLAVVPKAKAATTSTTATHASTADQATAATSATSATTAADAAKLGGALPAAFRKSSDRLIGYGDPTSLTQVPLFTIEPVGVTVLTDGDADAFTQLRFASRTVPNTETQGQIVVTDETGFSNICFDGVFNGADCVSGGVGAGDNKARHYFVSSLRGSVRHSATVWCWELGNENTVACVAENLG